MTDKQTSPMAISVEVPMDVSAEKAFLGCCLSGAFEKAIELGTTEDHFNEMRCKQVWQAMARLSDQGMAIEATTVCKEASGLVMFVDSLIDGAPASANLSYYWDDLNNACIRRRIFKRFHDTINMCSDPEVGVHALLHHMESAFFDVTTRSASSKNQKAAWAELIDLLQSAYGSGLPENGILTEIPSVDKIIRGFKPGSMNIIAARPGRGKSAFAVQIMRNAAMQGKHCVYWSYEMPFNQVGNRLIGCHSGIDMQSYLESGKLADEQALFKAVKQVASLPIHIEDSVDKNISHIRSEARRFAKEKNTKLFIIDYLQLVPAHRRNNNRTVEVSEISRSIKKAAMETGNSGAAFICLCQLNRSIEDRGANAEPRLADLRESGSLEQDADTVTFLADDPDDKALINVLVKKNRHGGEGSTCLKWTRWNGQFEAAEAKEEYVSKPAF